MTPDAADDFTAEVVQVGLNYLPEQYGPDRVITGLVAALAGFEVEAQGLALLPEGMDNALGRDELALVHEWLGQLLTLTDAQVTRIARMLLVLPAPPPQGDL